MMSTPSSGTGPSSSWAARIARIAGMSCWVAARIVAGASTSAPFLVRDVALGHVVSSCGRVARVRSGP